jgi:hypothetical protein
MFTPAALTKKSTGPSEVSTQAKKLSTLSRDATSSVCPKMAELDICIALSIASCRREPIATLAPLWEKRFAMANPIPVAPPVTTTVLFFSATVSIMLISNGNEFDLESKG